VRYLPWRNPLSSVYHDLFMHRQLAQDQLDVMHFPANYGFAPHGTRTIITLHDAINILPLREIIRGHQKSIRSIGMMSYLHFCSTASVRRADLLLTVSAHAGREIARHSGFDPQRIIAIPHAPTPDLRRITDLAALMEVRQKYGLTQPFVLADALKNPATLVRAWRKLPQSLRDDNIIVFFSRRPDPLPIVNEAVEVGHAKLLVRPSREDLIALYSMAEAFVFPSWIEGFGIPVLEAMTCGAPVIASDRGAIPEVLSNAGLIADAEDDAAFAQHITHILSNPEDIQRLREQGFARAAEFSWQKTAQRILESYERVVQQQPGMIGQPQRTARKV
jgi:glycosyltransferase involved in cell wall biosynthesis